MNEKIHNREWVKSAAIVFLSILLVLTFFSNTILNYSLPEVATAAVDSGSITAKVKGTGKATAIGNTEVKSISTTSIASVKAKEGAEVSEGDILFIMGEESEELTAAQDELDALRFDLQRYSASYPSNSAAYYAYETALSDLSIASKELEKAKNDLENYEKNNDINQASKNVSDAEIAMNNVISSKNAARTDSYKKYDDLKIKYEAETDPTEKENLRLKMEAALAEYQALQAESPEETSAIAAYNAAVKRYDTIIDATTYSEYKAEYNNALARFEAADATLTSAENAYYSSIDSNNSSSASISINIQETYNKIAKAEAKVAELSGGEDNAITAPVGGTISSISVSPGDKVAKGDILCIIEVPDMGYTMSYSVTNDQAKRIKVGDTASVSNYYWGTEILATVSSIKVDPKNPQTNKLITFTLDGDISNGSELTVSVGEKSATYDVIVPNSSVRTDANGTFVLKVVAKNNALGNRYFVQRVPVEVLATDDNNSALSGDLTYGDFVITTSSSPIKNGDQIKMADNG